MTTNTEPQCWGDNGEGWGHAVNLVMDILQEHKFPKQMSWALQGGTGL